MNARGLHACLCSWLLLLAGASFATDNRVGTTGEHYEWLLPPGFPVPLVPAYNPMSLAKVALGRRLFYESRLSVDGDLSCADCHQQARAFSDGLPRAVATAGEEHRRNTPSLANLAYNASFSWASVSSVTLENQVRVPFYSQRPVELGVGGREEAVLAMIEGDAMYASAFQEVFAGDLEYISIDNIIKAIAAFTRTLVSGDSPYDRLVYRDEREGMSKSAWRGMHLFFSARTACAECHGGFNFSGPARYSGGPVAKPAFHNTGLYDVDGKGAYPRTDQGLVEESGKPQDMGKFRAPSLRNIALTAPYMHDGSIPTLEGVIEHYAAAGDQTHPLQDPLLQGFTLSEEEKQDLVEFLRSLTDRTFITAPQFSAP